MRSRWTCLAAVACVLSAVHVASGASRTDPLRRYQWGLDQVHAEEAWQVSDGRGVVVAVLDSGVDAQHPDLRGALVPGLDLTGGRQPADDCGHGTEVAGVIAARAHNGIGLAGLAPGAKVMALKDGPSCATDVTLDIKGIRFAADHHARVVNYSSGTLPVVGDALFDAVTQSDFQAAVDYAWARGTLVVAAAGNSSIPLCAASSSVRHVLCVGAVAKTGLRSSYSQGDATGQVDYLVAPGGDDTVTDAEANIWTTEATLPSGGTTVGGGSSEAAGYAQVNGTSFAAPFVSAVAALLFARGLSVQQVHDRLLHCTTDLGLPGRDPVYGYGEVDAVAAVTGHGCR